MYVLFEKNIDSFMKAWTLASTRRRQSLRRAKEEIAPTLA